MRQGLGLVVPLSAITSSSSWGIGGIGDLEILAPWLQSAGCDRLMLLPIHTMPADQTSPYSACSAMALDPIYISMERCGTDQGGEDHQQLIEPLRVSPRVRFADVRRVKEAALRRHFDHFLRTDWAERTIDAADFAGFTSREQWWLDDYALFRSCETLWPGTPWYEWPDAVAHRDETTLRDLRRQLNTEIRYTQYTQWIADRQWRSARRILQARGISLYGDLPFMVNAHSADVWCRQREFRRDVSVGVPPDNFSATGQDWGLPMFRWDVMVASGFSWIHERARRMASLFDGFRVDHVVGLYRTYGRPPDGEACFFPPDQPAQLRQGEEVLRTFLRSGATVVVEDLGTVPDFVRTSIAGLGIAGYKVLRWEREWDAPEQPFILPAHYPRQSVATTGTHDTESVAAWWSGADHGERVALVHLLERAGQGQWDVHAPWGDELRDALLRTVTGAASEHVFLPVQDLFGWFDRINTPATVSDDNWTWRLPWCVDTWASQEQACERAAFLRSCASD